jgi:hypothetical protein
MQDFRHEVEIALDFGAEVFVLQLLHVTTEEPLSAVATEQVGVVLIF